MYCSSINCWQTSKCFQCHPKPLLFLIPNEGATMGDIKPLLILAVIAAQVSIVYILSNIEIPGFFEKYAAFVLGLEWNKKIILLNQCDDFNKYFVLSVNVKFNSIPDFNFDFGDTEGNARMTTSLLPNYSKTFVGPVYLPLNITWSNTTEVIKFKNRHVGKTCITLAGTQSSCFLLSEVIAWLNNNSNYILIIVCDHEHMEIDQDRVLVLRNYIEFEDLIKFSDIWITNGGNGSITLALVFGVTQMCSWKQFIVGMDKYSNKHQISKVLKVGPPKRNEFYRVMFDFIMNKDEYTTNAKIAQKQIQMEYELMLKNMKVFFQEIANSQSFQMELSNNRNRRRPKMPNRFLVF